MESRIAGTPKSTSDSGNECQIQVHLVTSSCQSSEQRRQQQPSVGCDAIWAQWTTAGSASRPADQHGRSTLQQVSSVRCYTVHISHCRLQSLCLPHFPSFILLLSVWVLQEQLLYTVSAWTQTGIQQATWLNGWRYILPCLSTGRCELAAMAQPQQVPNVGRHLQATVAVDSHTLVPAASC